MHGKSRAAAHRFGETVGRIVPPLLGSLALLAAPAALANGVLQSVTGDVRVAAGSSAPSPAVAGGRFDSGATITSGAGSAAVLRFDDGHTLLLQGAGELRVADFRFDPDKPRDDKIELRLVSGALRSVTGLVGQRNRDRVLLALPQGNVRLRGTDFSVVLAGAAYLSVAQGAIAVNNAAGTVVFSAGALGTVKTNAALAAPIASSAVPAGVSAAFRSLGSVAMDAPAGSGAGGASVGYSGAGVTPGVAASGTLIAIGAAVAAIAAVGSRKTATAAQH